MNRNFKDFLKTVSDDLEALLKIDNDKDGKPDFRYHMFILLSVGIEMLGATFDSYDWFTPRQSEKRFNNALEKIKSLNKYKNCDLYEHLRCGMAHVYVPNNKIGINTKSEGGKNLDKISDKTLIQIEQFYLDFKMACEEVINSIELENKLNLSNKAFELFMSVPIDNTLASGRTI
jgi:hypothetical protein